MRLELEPKRLQEFLERVAISVQNAHVVVQDDVDVLDLRVVEDFLVDHRWQMIDLFVFNIAQDLKDVFRLFDGEDFDSEIPARLNPAWRLGEQELGKLLLGILPVFVARPEVQHHVSCELACIVPFHVFARNHLEDGMLFLPRSASRIAAVAHAREVERLSANTFSLHLRGYINTQQRGSIRTAPEQGQDIREKV